MKKNDEDIINELKKTDENSNVEDIFEPSGKMKYTSETMSEPTTRAKRKTLLISFALIAIIISISLILSNINNEQSKASQKDENFIDNNLNSDNFDNTNSIDTNISLNDIYEEVTLNTNDYLSNNGFLYSIENKSNITKNGLDILYVYENDIVNSNNSNTLNIYLVESNEQDYTLTDVNENTYTLSKLEYNELLEKYSFNSEIIYPTLNSGDFNELTFMSAIEMNKNSDISTNFVNTRYLATSGNYGVIICSPKDLDDDLHGYIFTKENGEWDILVSEYQNIDNYLNYVNTNYAYMDIDLLLNMDINKYPKDSYITDLDGVVNGMLVSNIISENDLPMTYGVGLDNLIYMEFTSGLAFVGVIYDGSVTTYPVVNTFETKTIFEKFNNDPPYIILKQY